MNSWIVPALMSMLLYGLWAFLPKLSVRYLAPQSAILWEIVGAMLAGLVFLLLGVAKPAYHPKGVVFAAATGFSILLAGLFYLYAAQKGNIGPVATVSALYPVVAIALGYFLLGEPVSARQFAGVACALLAIWLLAG